MDVRTLPTVLVVGTAHKEQRRPGAHCVFVMLPKCVTVQAFSKSAGRNYASGFIMPAFFNLAAPGAPKLRARETKIPEPG